MKATIGTKSGTSITIDGSPEDVAKVLGIYKESPTETPHRSKRTVKKTQTQTIKISDLIRELISEGFFDKPKGLSELKMRLGELGHTIPVTTLSPLVLGLTKSKNLRRLQQDGRWVYAKL